MPNTQQGEGKFVERFEMAVMEFVILQKAQQQGGITKENLQQTFKGSLGMKYEHLDHCVNRLVQEKHLKEEGNSYRITDDGREDVQEVQRLALEVSNVANQGGGQKTQGQTQQKTTGGQSGMGMGGSELGASSAGGGSANQPGQPKGGPGNSTR